MKYIIYISLFLLSTQVSGQEDVTLPKEDVMVSKENVMVPKENVMVPKEDVLVLEEGFEAGSLSEVTANWDDTKNTAGMSFSSDVPKGSPGKKSLVMTYTPGENSGGHLFKLLPEGYRTLYARFYVKFMEGHRKVHHLVKLGGNNPPIAWPAGRAGIKPSGDDRFISGIEPIGDRWSWDFYTYWMFMRGYGDPNYHWGNTFHPDPGAKIKQGEWICVEFMVKMNDPVESSNGEQAFWINGEKVLHMGEGFPSGYWAKDRFYPHPDSSAFEGFQWRKTDDLKINFFWLSYYMTDETGDHTDSILFDDVILSTGYIGPHKGN